jgi:hypothetical protein
MLLSFIGMVGLLDLGLFVARNDEPSGSSTGWTELGPSDPRVSGVFAVLHHEGLVQALDSLQRLAQTDSLVLRGGHQLAHALGREAVMARGNDATVIGQCRPIFSSGCFHGVVEGYLNARGRIDVRALNAMCRSAGDVSHPGPIYECMHGLGHGILGAVGLDANLALRYCDQLDGKRYEVSCHEGVFMEAISSALNNHDHMHGASLTKGAQASMHGHAREAGHLTLDPVDPYSPCRTVDSSYAQSCWLFQGFVLLRRLGFDAKAALDACALAPDGWAGRCTEGVGHQLAGLFQRSDQWILQQCKRSRPELQASCVGGALYALVSLDWSGARAVGFCSAAGSPHATACFAALGPLLYAVAPQGQLATACTEAAPELQKVCLRGDSPS